MEKINDPCIPVEVCGMPTFDFFLTFTSFTAWMLAMASFVVPNWGVVTMQVSGSPDPLSLDSGVWQICWRATPSDVEGTAPRKPSIYSHVNYII